MTNKESVISYHTFMLPFTFEGDFNKKDNWVYKKFKIEEHTDFNQYVYFYKHVQEAILNTKNEQEEFVSKYYEYKEQNGCLNISTSKGTFKLKLDGISLRVFNTNIAILSFNLINTNYTNKEDILVINDFGRRIYPQFLGIHFTDETKQTFLANSISLEFTNQDPIVEDFTKFNKKENLENIKDELLPKYIKHLITNNFEKQNIRPLIDDRMFVISLYANDDFIHNLQQYDNKNGYRYEEDIFWYKYLFIDSNLQKLQSKNNIKKFIKKSTYDKWIETNSLFGISRYSFVILTDKQIATQILISQIKSIYFQLFSLLLAYRASIIKFSDDIQEITEEKDKYISNKTQNLYKNYINFVNKLYFKEITAQDQGIEIYDKAIQIMRIDQYMKELDNEINELHSYTDMIDEKQRSIEMDKLNRLGYIFLPGTFIAGLFGMNTIVGLDNIFGLIISFCLIWYSTKYISETNNIDIKQFFYK